jgi:hypothetical protein
MRCWVLGVPKWVSTVGRLNAEVRQGNSGDYPVQTIGPAAGHSIARQVRNPTEQQQQPRKPSSGTPQGKRSTFGPGPSTDPEPHPEMPSPIQSMEEDFENETQAYFDRSLEADNTANMASIASYGLAEHPDGNDEQGEDFIRELRALEDERRARAYADMSAAVRVNLPTSGRADAQDRSNMRCRLESTPRSRLMPQWAPVGPPASMGVWRTPLLKSLSCP